MAFSQNEDLSLMHIHAGETSVSVSVPQHPIPSQDLTTTNRAWHTGFINDSWTIARVQRHFAKIETISIRFFDAFFDAPQKLLLSNPISHSIPKLRTCEWQSFAS